MKLFYRTYYLDKKSELIGKTVKRPVILMEFGYEGQFVSCDGVIDSGSDICIFPADFGEQIGVDIRSGEPGFAGNVRGEFAEGIFLHRITLKIGERHYPTIAGFSYAQNRLNYGLLGQQGFFNLFKVQFDFVKNEIELEEY